MKDGWQAKSFEDCVEPVTYTRKIQRKDFLDQGEFPVISQESEFINGYWNDASDLFKPSTPIIIFGDHTQILKYVDFDFVLGADGVKILPPREFLLPKFFYYQLQSATLGSLGYARHYRLLKELQITYPSQPEQKRIANILDEAFDNISTAKANAEKNLQNASALFESHLESAFGVTGTEWKETTLQKVLNTQPRNGWSPPAANHSDSGTPVLTLSSVTGFEFRQEKIKYTSISADARRHYWVSNDDLLISRSNTPQLVGHVAIVSGVNIPTIYPDLIMRMNPDPAQALTRFLWYQLRTQKLRNEIMGRAQGANPTMKKIDKEAVQTLPIRIPSLENQKHIVAQLNSIAAETGRLSAIYQRKLGLLDSLKKSLLGEAFSGKL